MRVCVCAPCVKDISSRHLTASALFLQLPDGVELTLSELREMAGRQQQQIDDHQQQLVAKEQRLKYLKQQVGASRAERPRPVASDRGRRA